MKETRILIHKQGQIAYEIHGTGPLVVCIPGMGDIRAEYRMVIPAVVSAGFQVAVMDIRGHGQSSTNWDDFSVAGIGQDIVALIREINNSPAVIIGTSMAAGAAVWVAAEAPEWVRRLILIGPFVRGETSNVNRMMYSALFSRPWGPSVWKKYYASLYPTRKPEDFSQYAIFLKNNLTEPGRMEALQKMMVTSKKEAEIRLNQVKAPTLVIMGSRDPDFKDPQAEASWVAQQLNGNLKMIGGAGHYPHAEMPELVLPEMINFLKE